MGGVVWLLFLATLINYTDRLALNDTQRYLLPEFDLAGPGEYAGLLLAVGWLWSEPRPAGPGGEG